MSGRRDTSCAKSRSRVLLSLLIFGPGRPVWATGDDSIEKYVGEEEIERFLIEMEKDGVKPSVGELPIEGRGKAEY